MFIMLDNRDSWEGNNRLPLLLWDQGACPCKYPGTWPLAARELLSETAVRTRVKPVFMQQQMKYICLLADLCLFMYGKWK